MNDPKESREDVAAPDAINVSLTAEERDFLACILYQAVGGSPRGPRKIGEEIAEKLGPRNVNRFDVEIESVNSMLSPAVVVRRWE